jgi:hypothetical protein
MAADAGITAASRVAVFWEDQHRLLIIKVVHALGRQPQTRKRRSCAGNVFQVSDLGWMVPEVEAAYFPNGPWGNATYTQRDCRPLIVPKPDGNEIHILPPAESVPEPEPEDDEAEFGVG